MSALLAIGNVRLFVRSDQDAGILLSGITKQPNTADWHVAGLTDGLFRVIGVPAQQRTNQNPRVADEHAQAGQHEEFRELAPADVALIGGMNREFVLPKRFFARAAK